MFLYILENRIPVPTADPILWGTWMERNLAERTVQRTMIDIDFLVSTVFLGLDHSFMQDTPPVLFETCVFYPSGWSDVVDRYYTWELAEVGHWEVVDKLMKE